MVQNKYISDAKVLQQPMTGKAYVYRKWAADYSAIGNPSETPIVWEELTPDADMLAVGFVDGHVEMMKKDAFEKLLKATEERFKAPGLP